MAAINISLVFKHNFQEAERQSGEIPDRLDRAMASGTEKATGYVESAYKELIPKRSSKTADTIDSFVESRPNGAIGYVGTDSQIAQFLEYGTPAHVIRPRPERIAEWKARSAGARKKGQRGPRPPALAFEIGGRTVFARSVNHPGTNPTESLQKAGEISIGRIEQAFTTEVGEVLR